MWVMSLTFPIRQVVLQDHARLPGRFFGRMTSAVLAGL
jgi:hypothetical protein